MEKEVYSGSGASLSEIISSKEVVYFDPHQQFTIILKLEQLIKNQFKQINALANSKTFTTKQGEIKELTNTYKLVAEEFNAYQVQSIKKQLPLFRDLDFGIFNQSDKVSDFIYLYNTIINFDKKEKTGKSAPKEDMEWIVEEFNWTIKFLNNDDDLSNTTSNRISKFRSLLEHNVKYILNFPKALLDIEHRVYGFDYVVLLNTKYQKKYVYNRTTKLKRLKLVRQYNEPTFNRDAKAFFDGMYSGGVYQSCYTTLTNTITNRAQLQAQDHSNFTEFLDIVSKCVSFLYNNIITLLKFNDKSDDIEQVAQKYADLGQNKFDRVSSRQTIKLREYQAVLKSALKNLSYRKRKAVNLQALRELSEYTSGLDEISKLQIISILFFNDMNIFTRFLKYYNSFITQTFDIHKMYKDLLTNLDKNNVYYLEFEKIIKSKNDDSPLFGFEELSTTIIFNVIGDVFQEYSRDQFSSRIFNDDTKEIIPTVPISAYLTEYLDGYTQKKSTNTTFNDYNEVIQKLTQMSSMYILLDGQNEELFSEFIETHRIEITSKMISDLIDKILMDQNQVPIAGVIILLEKILDLVKNCESYSIPVFLVALEDLEAIKESSFNKVMRLLS